MINVNKITSTLAKLPDQQLQQYAEMHKNDPYIMALAMSESNRRKEMRAASQAPAQQEQPKVVDQMVAEMAPQQLPEDQGIAQLSAGDMSFAGGGIVAFADGGDVERYQSQGLVQPRARWEDALAELQAPPQESSALGRAITGAFSYSSDLDAIRQNARAKQIQGLPLSAQEEAVLRTGAQPVPAASRQPSPFEQERTRNMQQVANEGYTRGDPRALPSMPSAAEQLKASNAAPTADTGRKDTERKDAAQKTPAAPVLEKPSVLDPNAMFAAELAKTSKEVRPEKALLETLIADRKKSDEDELTGLKGLNEKFKDAFKSKRERLDTREDAIGKMRDQNLGLALLQAGAAMMSTPGSLGTAIGKGVQAGSQQYVAGIDKINSAKDKLADARDRLDDLQLNRDEMSAREILKAENKIRQTALSGQETMIKYVMERDKVDRETAMKIVDNEVKIALNREDNVSREKIARISAEPALERNKLLKLANNKDDKVRTEYGKLQAKVMDTLSKDPNYTMANPMQQQVLQTTALRQALMSNPFLAPYAAGIGFSSAPAGGKVYDLTED